MFGRLGYEEARGALAIPVNHFDRDGRIRKQLRGLGKSWRRSELCLAAIPYEA